MLLLPILYALVKREKVEQSFLSIETTEQQRWHDMVVLTV